VQPLNMEDAPGVPTTPTLSIGDAILPRPGANITTSMLFPVILSQPQLSPLTLTYSSNDNTATAGTDYAANTSNLTFTDSSGTVTFSYGGVAATPLLYNNSFGATGQTTAGDVQAILDTIPALAGNVSVTGSLGSFTVTFLNNLQANLLTAGGTDPVTFALSYSGSVTIPAGQLSATIAVPIIGDATVQAD